MGYPHEFETKGKLTIKERLVTLLVMYLISILAPWKYNHEQKEFFEDILDLVREKETYAVDTTVTGHTALEDLKITNRKKK